MTRTAALVVFWLLSAFAVAEFVCAALGFAPAERAPLLLWEPAIQANRLAPEGGFVADPRWLWEPAPKWQGVLRCGARVTRAVHDDAALRIACLGGALTFGAGVKPVDSWPSLVEARLREAGRDVEVRNYGVIGQSVVQGCARYEGLVREWKPQIVAVCFGGLSEYQRPPQNLGDPTRMRLMSSWNGLTAPWWQRFACLRWIGADSSEGTADEMRETMLGELRVRVSIASYAAAIERLAQDVAADGAMLLVVFPVLPSDAGTRWPSLAQYQKELNELAVAHQWWTARAESALVADEQGELAWDVAGNAAVAPPIAEVLERMLAARERGH